MRRRMYGTHGAILSTRAKEFLFSLAAGAGLAAVVAMPLWMLMLGWI